MDQLDEWERIERYWLGQLSASDTLLFEQTMQHDKRLAEEARALQFGVKLVDDARAEAHARQIIRRLHQATRRRRLLRTRWQIGVSVLAAACLAFITYLAYAPVSLPAGSQDVSVLRDFRDQYRDAPTDQLSVRQKQVFDLFFEGQAYLAEGQLQRAAYRFERVLAFPQIRPYFREAAQWHLMSCYVQTGEVDKAQWLYPQLAQTSDYDVSRLERWKVWWHLQRLKWLGPLPSSP